MTVLNFDYQHINFAAFAGNEEILVSDLGAHLANVAADPRVPNSHRRAAAGAMHLISQLAERCGLESSLPGMTVSTRFQ